VAQPPVVRGLLGALYFHSAFTLAIGQSMWLGVGAAALAVLATLFLREIPLRQTLGPQTVPSRAATSETAAEPATRIPSQPAVD